MQFPLQKGRKRIHRLVVLPEYQGLGIGTVLLNTISELYCGKNWEVYIITSNRALNHSLKRDKHWHHMRTMLARDSTNNNFDNMQNAKIGTGKEEAGTRILSTFKTTQRDWL